MTDRKNFRRIIIALVCQCLTATVSIAAETSSLDAALMAASWLDLAEKAGRRLIELGKPKNGGLDWVMDPEYPRLILFPDSAFAN
jgi:hypothetical protein